MDKFGRELSVGLCELTQALEAARPNSAKLGIEFENETRHLLKAQKNYGSWVNGFCECLTLQKG